ncbi:BspA family leucine-rich repeat surface protein [Methanobrevibacter sp.]|uniref:BspA family leucine-rich repeat surface protein n=1 Tax=Methanobrevibacter sp. TaxID=66852 RepID=UPI0038904ED7
MNSRFLIEFEKLNTTCNSIYDFEEFDVLIILNDGTNLTSWNDVENKNEIIYVSEDLSKFTDLSYKYADLTNLKAIVADVTDKVIDMNSMFYFCKSLKDISFLNNWDVSNVKNMEYMFSNCVSLADLCPLKDWDVSKVISMECMFENCKSLKDISPLSDWNVSNVNVNYTVGMFDGCGYDLDLSIFKEWDMEMLTDRNWAFTGWR